MDFDNPLVVKAVRHSTQAWFSAYARIWPKSRDGGLVTPIPNYLQRLAAQVTEKMRSDNLPVRIIGLKPRQRGSTTWFTAEGYCALRRSPCAGLVVGGQYSQTAEAWSMIQTYQANDGFDWQNTGEVNGRAGRWSHGSTLRQETARDVHAGIAGTFQLIHVTELGRWSNEGGAAAGEVLANLLKCCPALPGTMIVLESTAEGDSGEFPARWKASIPAADYLSGKVVPKPGDYVGIFAPWYEFSDSATKLTEDQRREVMDTLDADERFGQGGEERRLLDAYAHKDADGGWRMGGGGPGTADAWEQLAWRRQTILTECKRDWRNFDQDYPHSANVAFLSSGRGVFAPGQLDRVEAASLVLAGRIQRGCLDRVPLAMSRRPKMVWRVTPEHESWSCVWERPMPGRSYLVVVDPATGSERASGEDPDRHSALVLRAGAFREMQGWEPSAIVARVRPPCACPIDVLADWVDRLSWFYGRCLVAFEVNNSGLALYEALKVQPFGCPPLYERETQEFRRTGPEKPKLVGWDTTEPSRRLLVETLQREVRELGAPGAGVLVPCEHAMEELRRFVVLKGKAQAGRGAHDDDPLALGIGLCLLPMATKMGPVIEQRELTEWERNRQFQAAQRAGMEQVGAVGTAMRS